MIYNTREFYMQKAITLSQEALQEGEIPIGCIIVKKNKIIGKGWNSVEKLKDATAHAEFIAITSAQQYLKSKYLNFCDIYITIEPCLMCMGAILNTRIQTLYFGAFNDKYGFSKWIDIQDMQKKIHIETGILNTQCIASLQQFFKRKK